MNALQNKRAKLLEKIEKRRLELKDMEAEVAAIDKEIITNLLVEKNWTMDDLIDFMQSNSVDNIEVEK